MAVTTDFSEASRAALAPAACLAKRLGARLSLVHVARDPTGFFPWQARQKAQYQAEATMPNLEDLIEALARSEPALEGVPVKCRVLHGRGAEAVSALQEDEGIDLLVLATEGHTGVKQFLLGSFAAKLVQLATCPVLFIRAQDSDDKLRSALAFPPRHILVPHDFSKASVDCLPIARELARKLEAKVRLLHVVDTRREIEGPTSASAADLDEYYENVRAECMASLRQLIASEWVDEEAEACVRLGHPALEIIKEAHEFPADLIVMASRGLTLLDRISLGSVTEKAVHRAPCPVLVTKGSAERLALTQP